LLSQPKVNLARLEHHRHRFDLRSVELNRPRFISARQLNASLHIPAPFPVDRRERTPQ